MTAIDLFAGAGGLSLAFHEEGFDIVAAVESDRRACETYRTSFIDRRSPTTALVASDVKDPYVRDHLTAALGGRPLDVLVGGPPCQDFSPARLRRCSLTERAALVMEYAALVNHLQPRAFLFENVPGLLTADDGRTWERLVQRMGQLGYEMEHRKLDAQEFGVPQRRLRLFVVGMSRSAATEFRFPEPSGIRRTAWDAIGHLPRLSAGECDPQDPDHRVRKHRPEIVAYLSTIPAGGSWRTAADRRVLPCHEGHNGHYDVYGRVRADEVAPTITGGCTNPSRGRFIHPYQDRGLTVREAALLQTFPPDWQFCGGIEASSQQVGNAVPVLLGRALASSLAVHLARSAEAA